MAWVVTALDSKPGQRVGQANHLRRQVALLDVGPDLGIELAQERVDRIRDLVLDVGTHGFPGCRRLRFNSGFAADNPVRHVDVVNHGLGSSSFAHLEVRAEPDAGVPLTSGPVTDPGLLGFGHEQFTAPLLQGPKVELLHQVGNALVHGHHVQDPDVRRHIAGGCRFPVGPCVKQVFSKVNASPEQVAPGV